MKPSDKPLAIFPLAPSWLEPWTRECLRSLGVLDPENTSDETTGSLPLREKGAADDSLTKSAQAELAAILRQAQEELKQIGLAGLAQGEGDPRADGTEVRSVRWSWQGFAAQERVAWPGLGQVMSRLEEALCRWGLRHWGVWARLAPWPWPHRAAFSFRVDYDRYHPEHFAQLWKQVEPVAEWTSHFITASAYQNAPEAVARFRGVHVGGHGYFHHCYRDPKQNRQNILRGLEALQRWGLSPWGFAAPGGRFPRHMPQLLSELGLPFSSEFQLAWDTWPFFLPGTRVLQVPIHPVCLGSFLECCPPGAPEETLAQVVQAAGEYFACVLEVRLGQGKLVVLYGHPTGRLGRWPQVLQRVFAQVKERSSVWCTSLAQLARWWQARACVKWRLECFAWGVAVWAGELPQGWTPGVEVVWEEQVAQVPLRPGWQRWRWEQLPWSARPRMAQLPTPQPVPEKASWKTRLRHWLDWEYETPWDQLPWWGWPQVVKKTLRWFKNDKGPLGTKNTWPEQRENTPPENPGWFSNP